MFRTIVRRYCSLWFNHNCNGTASPGWQAAMLHENTYVLKASCLRARRVALTTGVSWAPNYVSTVPAPSPGRKTLPPNILTLPPSKQLTWGRRSLPPSMSTTLVPAYYDGQ